MAKNDPDRNPNDKRRLLRTDDHMQQLVAAEALIAATQKKKDSNFIVSNGVEILKQLYKSKNDHIKVDRFLTSRILLEIMYIKDKWTFFRELLQNVDS
jgi:histidine ammonia-lyase